MFLDRQLGVLGACGLKQARVPHMVRRKPLVEMQRTKRNSLHPFGRRNVTTFTCMGVG